MTELVEIVVTGPPDQLPDLARTLVEERLVACAQLTPITSAYRWEGRVAQDDEVRAMLHTTAEGVDAVTARVLELHPYDVPCVLVLPVVHAEPRYAQWAADATTP